MDLIDRKIVACLQTDARLSIAQIADRVGLSQTPCWKRIQRLEESGVIRGRVALVNPQALGLGLTVFVSIATDDHTPVWRDAFVSVVGAMPEVLDIYRMAGDVDYTLRVVVKDMPAYDAFYKRLTEAINVKAVTSRFAMEAIKTSTAFPVDTTNR
jgi:Lrp/AsnC family transcriptional regulator